MKKLRKVRFLGVDAEESDESIQCESLADVFKLKEEEVNALNYNCDFNRLTQLFSRPLILKYVKEQHDVTQNKPKKDEIVNDQGDFLDDLLGADNNLPIDD